MKRGSLYLLEAGGKGRSPLGIAADPLASGGDAQIYRIPGRAELAAKIYHEPGKDPQRPGKIAAMLAMPPDLPPIQQNGTSYIQIAWPTGGVEDDRGRFAGYVMPFVDLERATELANLLAGKTRRMLGLREFYGFRVVAAANLAALVAALHSRGHHIIDLKPVNLSVYLDTFYLALLDCDGLSIQGRDGRRFAAHQYTEGYIAPEALQRRLHPRDLGEDQDRFALAVILFQLLNNGIHPYQGVPLRGADLPATDSGRIQQNLYAYGRRGHKRIAPSPWSIHTFLEDDTRELFDRAFGLNPKQRPTADDWKHHLQALADPRAARLQRCPRNPDHGMFSKGCGFCRLQARVRSQKANPVASAVPAASHHRTHIRGRSVSYIIVNTATGNILVPVGKAGAAQANPPRDWWTILAARWASLSYAMKAFTGIAVIVLIFALMAFFQLRHAAPVHAPHEYGTESGPAAGRQASGQTPAAMEPQPEDMRQFTDEETAAWLAGKLFVRRDGRGKPLPVQDGAYETHPWRCVSDEMSGLTWLVKDNLGGLHDVRNQFTLPMAPYGQTSPDGSDILSYRDRARSRNACGASDWRVPRVEELKSLAYPHLRSSFPYWPGIHLWGRNEKGQLVLIAAHGLLGREPGEGFGVFSGAAGAMLVRGRLRPLPIPPREAYVVVRYIRETRPEGSKP